MRTRDNNLGECVVADGCVQDLGLVANKSLLELVEQNPNILMFPLNLGHYKDDIEKNVIFNLDGNKLTTYNILGFLGINDTQLTISSRFENDNNENDFFLHYMLQRVFSLNILDFKVNTSHQSIWDIFLIYLFPYYLNKAINQGLYKVYKNAYYNNANVKGKIDIKKHLKVNQLFTGSIAYKTREHSYDNSISQLIRHTIEFIRQHPLGHSVLNKDFDTRNAYQQIMQATPSYKRGDRTRLISESWKPLCHPYFTEYEHLRRICLQILRNEGLSFGKEKDSVYGLIFDGAWLWEEYLNTVLKELSFIHPENKKGKSGNPIYLFQDNSFARYPDFYHPNRNLVLDAKYKFLNKNNKEIDRNDIHQIISYMYTLQADKGGFIFPYIENNFTSLGKLNGYAGEVFKYGFKIPENQNDYKEFVSNITKSESALKVNSIKLTNAKH